QVRGPEGLVNATVTVQGRDYRAAEGSLVITVTPGTLPIVATAERLAPATVEVTIAAGETRDLVITLEAQPTHEEEVTVTATRNDKRLDEQPMRVEVLAREEIEEKMLMTPGDIVMMLNEMGGMRVQATSPSLGAASVRIQGMRGRYTRFLSDGLPLFGEQVGALGLLQIPPMDLGQVEVIKGVASSLYGAGAMGGVVNMVARRPSETFEREILVNRSTRGATDVVSYFGGPVSERWGMTTLASGHWQTREDVEGDGWADLPGYSRGVIRPRAFWNGGDGRTLFATAGVTVEDRTGGTMPGSTVGGAPFVEALRTTKYDAGAVGQTLLKGNYVVTGRFAFAQQHHTHQFGTVEEPDRHTTGFGEVAIRGVRGKHAWVAGAAIEHDGYDSRELPQFDYGFTIPGIFAQDDIVFAPWLTISASGRFDHHSEYGSFFSPRVSALARSGRWNARVSLGTGFFGPTPLTEETEATGLTNLVIPRPLQAERGRSGSFDITRTDGPLSYPLTLFASRVAHPIHVDRSSGLVLTNLDEPGTNRGVEFLATLRHAEVAVTGTYTFVDARETVDGVAHDLPLTPRHSAGIVGMWEREDVGRIGLEWYYTGAQGLEENPYRAVSEPYVIVGALVERQFGKWRVFVNMENLGGVRQTRWDPLLRPTRAPDGRWTVDAWAPLEGRNINGGLRVRF
ncbi:MAG TPA: TonB-dependent receptor, partial [Vicinamibacterales bacterium]